MTLADVKACFSDTDYTRGLGYYNMGWVKPLTALPKGPSVYLYGTVRGTKDYAVHMTIQGDRVVNANCSCPRCDVFGSCKHLAAAAIAYVKYLEGQEDYLPEVDMSELFQRYLAQSSEAESGGFRLVPRMDLDGGRLSYPELSFRVGREKLYVVKNIKKFLESVQKRQTVTYGKNLTFCHSIENFDDRSQKLILILENQFKSLQTLEPEEYIWSDWRYGSENNAGALTLTGDAFDRFFDLFRDDLVETFIRGEEVSLGNGDPAVTFSLRKDRDGAVLEISMALETTFFGHTGNLYAMVNTPDGPECLRCSRDFYRWVYPLLERELSRVRLSAKDLPTFCGTILPRLEGLARVEDPENILEDFAPDTCTPRFYFDLQEDTLTAKLTYVYDEEELDYALPVEKSPKIKRNLQTEQGAQQQLERYMPLLQDDKTHGLIGDDEIYAFLSGHMEEFHRYGEVFVSESLRKKRIASSAVTVGVSVSDGMLTLELDTGEFPPEELEALYQSLLTRKKYHRLADGRYLDLDGSAYESLAEMSHMLQLSAKDLKEGSVKVPVYRSLYVDSVLSGVEGIQVSRDKQLRAMIRNFKSVAESDYILPDSLDHVLRPYQKVGFQWLKTLESCGFGGILADEMGLGKTAQVIAYLSTVSRGETGRPSLVVCPTSLIFNWGEELRRFAPQLRKTLILGNAKERKDLMEHLEETDVVVTSYELLRQDIKTYQTMHFYSCILDEAQHIKNQSTLVSKAVKTLDAECRFVLTGTPIENRLSELWNLFDFLMPGYLYTHNAFVEKLEKPIVKSKNPEALGQLRRLVQPFLLRRLKQDVLKELPPKIEYVRRVPLTEEERRVYAATAIQAKSQLEGQGKLAILAALTRLRQICCDPALCFENYTGGASKLEACLELCSGMVENGHQILLFSQFTSMLAELKKGLDQLGIRSFTLQGSTSKEKRAKLVKDFNNGGASVFLISLKAGGTGLNLTAADVVIHYDPWWNLAAQNQATDRAHRMGQKAHVQVYKLIAQGTIEEKILDLQEKKAALMDAISPDDPEGVLNLSKDDLLALLDI